MAGIKYLLQKEVFDETNEKIISVCNVQKLYKKKKNSYLCVASAPRSCPTLVQIKQSDKGVYRRKRVWQLSEIKNVDGKNDSTTEPVHEFDIVCEKQYKWFAANPHERQNLISVLHKQINKFVQVSEQRAIFVNVPSNWLLENSPEKVVLASSTKGSDSESDSDEFEDFHALTEKEENELNNLVSKCELVVTDAEQFMEQLSQNLQDLDGANVQSVLASEKQVNALMEQIELAITEADRVEFRLNEYDEILCHVRDTMEKMGEKNTMIEIANNNNIKLLSELDSLVTQLDLPPVQQFALTETDLTTPQGLAAAITAGKALQTAMNCEIDPALLRLTAVQDQRKRFEKWKAKFSATISRQLNNMFIHLANDLAESQLAGSTNGPSNVNPSDLVLQKHANVHKDLGAYSELMHWIKSMDRKTYDGLSKVYTTAMSKVYERELRHFFEMARASISQQLLADCDLNTSISSKFKSPQSTKQVSQPWGILGVNKELWSLGIDSNERKRFDLILEKVLAELEPFALSEQHFCIRFFQLDVVSPTTRNTQTTLDGTVNANANEDGNGDGNLLSNTLLTYTYSKFNIYSHFSSSDSTTKS